METLQQGQRGWAGSQGSIHPEWKPWLQGNFTTFSPTMYSSRHTAHVLHSSSSSSSSDSSLFFFFIFFFNISDDDPYTCVVITALCFFADLLTSLTSLLFLLNIHLVCDLSLWWSLSLASLAICPSFSSSSPSFSWYNLQLSINNIICYQTTNGIYVVLTVWNLNCWIGRLQNCSLAPTA